MTDLPPRELKVALGDGKALFGGLCQLMPILDGHGTVSVGKELRMLLLALMSMSEDDLSTALLTAVIMARSAEVWPVLAKTFKFEENQ